MAKPATYPDWATESDNVTAPPAARVRIGWEQYDRPTSSVFNWWKNLTSRWIRHFDEVVSEHGDSLAALNDWRNVIDNRALRARYSLPRQAVSDLEVITTNRYRLPIEDSAINVDSAQVRATSASEFRYSIEFSLELGPDAGLVIFSQADNIGSRMHLTTHHFERSYVQDGNPRNAELDVIVMVYDPSTPPPTGDAIHVPGLSVVAF